MAVSILLFISAVIDGDINLGLLLYVAFSVMADKN